MRFTVKKTLAKIRESGQHYVVQVKCNCRVLYQAFEALVDKESLSCSVNVTRHKGRLDVRETRVYRCPPKLEQAWSGAKQMIVQQRSGLRQGVAYQERHYYLSSVECNESHFFGEGIRNHWQIENALHWTKDVYLHEDSSRLKHRKSSAVMSLLKSWVLNIYRLNGYPKWVQAMAIFANRPDRLKQLKY